MLVGVAVTAGNVDGSDEVELYWTREEFEVKDDDDELGDCDGVTPGVDTLMEIKLLGATRFLSRRLDISLSHDRFPLSLLSETARLIFFAAELPELELDSEPLSDTSGLAAASHLGRSSVDGITRAPPARTTASVICLTLIWKSLKTAR